MLEQALSSLGESPLGHCDVAKREALNQSFSNFTGPTTLLCSNAGWSRPASLRSGCGSRADCVHAMP